MGFLIKYMKKIGFLIFIFILVIIIRGFCTSNQDKYNRNLSFLKKEDYSGVVIKKYIEKENHNRSFFILNDNSKISINKDAYEILQLGDSILKEKNKLFIMIFRGSVSFKVKLE
jgi:hypothetical protein|tara:strand:+ start:1283 stop:1624 length:342 start_codon:yes stop_codon:yes gene_type:complete